MGEILNERQHWITKLWLQGFEQQLEKKNPDGFEPQLHRLTLDALKSQIESFKKELAEYETLKGAAPEGLRLESLEELPIWLVKMRTVRGLTQRQLAERIGVKEQQIQRYERNDAQGYFNASYKRILEIAQALSINVQPTVFQNSDT